MIVMTKSMVIQIRVSPEQKEGYRSAAMRQGVSLSEWIQSRLDVDCLPMRLVEVAKPVERGSNGLCARCSRIGKASCRECKSLEC